MNHPQEMIDIACNQLLRAAVQTHVDAERLEDMITGWIDCTSQDETKPDWETELAEQLGEALMDAIRQVTEQREGISSVRISAQDGERLTFTWNCVGDDFSGFADTVMRSVRLALKRRTSKDNP